MLSRYAPNVGGRFTAVLIFAFTLVAFVVESQLTQYVQTNLGYRHPFFIFYLVHASFSIIFPLHFVYLIWTTNHTAPAILKGLSIAISEHLSPKASGQSPKFPLYRFLRLLAGLTLGITCPGLLWFAAISLASVSDVTAIWNTNAFFAYLISVQLFKLNWEPRKLFAVLLATAGTLAVVYGGVSSSQDPETPDVLTEAASNAPHATFIKPKSPLVGNLLTLLASFGYGLYQVLYKIYAALPSDPEVTSDVLYEQILEEEEERTDLEQNEADNLSSSGAVYPPPFGLHPNFLTSIMGLMTFLVLWIPIPILHWTGVETFSLPPNWLTAISIAGIALGGVVFNAGFMILLGVWGPIVTSVGNLLTIVLMLISDVVFGSGLESITFWSLLGSSVIVAAFGILAYDIKKGHST
ncbi:hypothetical protein FA15DRAFT_662375 [Coprinopsis marcescibilis]|uniref:EamA domain-containing protein n=1 Tax=Coprinopsis marcescibilis TaxID=230819 RepID=A0A5C3LD87_COPMA|nr:hypothetical protein FA15DRAFT_662375 [Coprinopsis marcescibilis]